MVKNNLFFLLMAIFLFLRFYHLPQKVNFSMDQGKTILSLWQTWQSKKIPLIGPESSLKSNHQDTFYYAPWVYYFLLPIMLVTNWQILAGSYFFIFLNLLALIFLYLASRQKYGQKTALIASLLFIFSPTMINFSQFIWNPNFLPFCSTCLFYLGVKIEQKKGWLLNFFLAGLVIGFGLGNHYSFILVALPFVIFLFAKKSGLKNFLVLLEGILISFIPLIFYELKNDFKNIRAVMAIAKYGPAKSIILPPPPHYYLCLIPFFYLLLALMINKISKKSYLLAKGLTLILIIYFLFQIAKPAKSGYTMPIGWNYVGIKKTANIILKENKKNYNLVNLLSGDTRSYGLRSFLTVKGSQPMKVGEYPISDYLFVLAKKDKNEVINIPLWEISSFCPCESEKTWEIQNGIFLYLLESSIN